MNTIGNFNDSTTWATDGIIDEARFSDSVRSSAWLKASYYTQTDALVAWGAEESPATDVLVSEQALALTLQSPTINFDYTVFLSEQKLALTQPSLEVIIGQVFLAQVFQLGLEQHTPITNYDYGLDLSAIALELGLPTPTTIGDANVLLSALGLELEQQSPDVLWNICVELSALGLEIEALEPLLIYWARQTKHAATWANSAKASAPTWTNLKKR